MSTLHTHVRHWTLLEGNRQGHSDQVVARIASAYAPGQRKGHFFAVVEAVDNAVRGRDACALVAQTLCATFYSDQSASITSALRRAFMIAHQELCAHNRQVSTAERTLVGASCAVIHDGSLYLAQVQPTQALLIHQQQVRTIPERDTTRPLLDYQIALGSPWYKSPELTRSDLHAGDTLIVCSSNVAQQIRPQQLDTLHQHDPRAIADALYDLSAMANLYEARALVVRWEAAPGGDDAIDAPRSHARRRLPDQVRSRRNGPRVLAREQPLPRTTVAARTERKKPRRLQQPVTEPARRSHATLDDGQPRPRRVVSRDVDRMPLAGHTVQTPYDDSRPSRRETASRRSAPQTTTRHRPAQRRRPVRWIAALLVGCVLALAGFGIQHYQQREWRAAAAALSQIDQSLAAAEGADTPDQAQHQLAAAETALRTTIEPLVQSGVITDSHQAVWSQYQQVLEHYDQAVATINRIGFIDQLQPVASLPDGQGLISRIVLSRTDQPGNVPPLLLLDRNGGRLFQQGQEAPLLEHGDLIADAPVQRLRDVLWRDNKPLVFERGDPAMPGYRMMYRDGGQWIAVSLARTETMAPIDGDLPLATFAGHVFVWDRDIRQVWKYTAEQLSAPPVPSISDAGNSGLDRVVNIAVDGHIYLLNSDGSIVIVDDTGTIVQQMPAPELALPLTTVARFVVTPDWTASDGSQQAGAIYLLDTQNERVVQLDKTTGEVVQQIQARQQGVLNQLTDLAVDEPNRMLYLANGAQVLQTPLPTPPVTGFNSATESVE